MEDVKLIELGYISDALKNSIDDVKRQCKIIKSTDIIDRKNDNFEKILFVIQLDEIGECLEGNNLLRKLYSLNNYSVLKNTAVGILINSPTEEYTKKYNSKFIYMLNKLGAEIIGHPTIEGIKDCKNYRTWKETMDESLENIYRIKTNELYQRLKKYTRGKFENLNVLVLHAGHKTLSNTLMLWNLIEENLRDVNIEKIHVEEGKITDCYGCKFETCRYFSIEKSCFYGGFVVEDLYPKIEKADIIIWICPNYNDALSAKLMAVINRMTALYRRIDFHDKYIGAVIVSGSSGNDSVACQLIGGLNVNKGFRMIPKFSINAIGNAAGEVLEVKGIEKSAAEFAKKINYLKIQKTT